LPDKHDRHSIRLKEYDYALPGAYFVTICTRDRACLFGHVMNGEMHLNAAGEIAQRCWEDIPTHFPSVELDAFVIMPNHVHGLIVITDAPQTTCAAKTTGSISRGSEIVIPCKGEASADRTIGPMVRAPGSMIPRKGERSFAPTTTTTVTPQSPSRTIGSIVRGSGIVIPCKGEASDFDGSWNTQIPGSDASPLRQRPNGTQPGSLSAIVQNFKSVSTRRMNAARGAPGTSVWQRNYYEHVVRNEQELAAIREHTTGNPARWDDDENNPAFVEGDYQG